MPGGDLALDTLNGSVHGGTRSSVGPGQALGEVSSLRQAFMNVRCFLIASIKPDGTF